MTTYRRVSILLWPDYGDAIERIAPLGPAWVPKHESTDALVARLRAMGRQVTTFTKWDDSVGSLLTVLDDVELHHGRLSCDQPVTVIEVLGMHPVERVREGFARLGFSDVQETAEGFIAFRVEAADPSAA